MAAHASGRFLCCGFARLAAERIRRILYDECVSAKTKEEEQRRDTQKRSDEQSRGGMSRHHRSHDVGSPTPVIPSATRNLSSMYRTSVKGIPHCADSVRNDASISIAITPSKISSTILRTSTSLNRTAKTKFCLRKY